MFSVYLYFVLILIILIILYLTHDQIVLSLKERKKRMETETLPVVKCENYYFSLSKDQKDYRITKKY
tara:strand:- start:280 stop:480 length:201 start_codon:yes stop_codon:yes gene_type:complete